MPVSGRYAAEIADNTRFSVVSSVLASSFSFFDISFIGEIVF